MGAIGGRESWSKHMAGISGTRAWWRVIVA